MGNHEYCEDCGESDFHLHWPCDPVKLAKKKREEEDWEEKKKDAKSKAKDIVGKLLDSNGIKWTQDHDGYTEVSPYQFIQKEESKNG